MYFITIKGTTANIAGGRLRSAFQKTEKLSTYLVGWTIAPQDFGRAEIDFNANTKVRIIKRFFK